MDIFEETKICDSLVAMTVLMPSWYYEKKDLKRSPSILDGLDADRESRYRREGARFIINVGTKMGLRYDTMATGVVYFHRFYMFHSFKTFPRYVTACCCLFLAGKVEETPKKCKDIIRIAKTFLADSQFTQFGDDPKEEVMTLERILLQTIRFDLQVDHPYGHLLKYAKSLKGDKVKLQNMVQMAWTFINDSLCTTLCLQFEPEVIAIALMYLAGKLSKFEVVDWIGRTSRHSHWWDMFVEGMSIELLEDICHQVLDLYSTPMSNPPQDSPPATPPTKSTRKTSQPPSPVEITTSPAQTKPKEAIVGLPIPRLEPGDLKRKTSQPEPKKEVLPDTKVPRITEGKAIPIITTSSSPKANSSILEPEIIQPSPKTPSEAAVKSSKHPETPVPRASSEPAYRSGIASNPSSYTQDVTSLPIDSVAAKPVPIVVPPPTTSFQPTVPPPAATFTQSAPPFYSGVSHETQPFPNLQQPPPQIFPQHPLQFQHPPPVTPSASMPGLHHPSSQFSEPPPPPQFPALPPGAPPPPFNSQYPPPPRHPPPILSNPPPASVQGLAPRPPPRPQGPPPGGLLRPPPRINDGPGLFGPGPGADMFSPRPEHRGGRPPLIDRRPPNAGLRGHFDSDSPRFRGRRDPDGPFPHEPPFPDFDPGFHRPPGQFGPSFERPMRPPPRRFPLDHRKHERGPRPPMDSNMQQGAPTGIAPVRITGSM